MDRIVCRRFVLRALSLRPKRSKIAVYIHNRYDLGSESYLLSLDPGGVFLKYLTRKPGCHMAVLCHHDLAVMRGQGFRSH